MTDDADPLAGLPKDLDYIREVALKYGNYNGPAGIYERTLGNLNASQLQEIRNVYRKMDDQGDAPKLSEWIFRHEPIIDRDRKEWLEKERQGTSVKVGPIRMSPAMALFGVFEYLSFKGVEPFASGTVSYSPPLNWGKLPTQDLLYIGEAAVKWKRYQSYDKMHELAKTITPDQLEELRSLARRMRSSGDEQAAQEWSSVVNFSRNPEQELVYFFIRLLNEFVPTHGELGIHEKLADEDPDLEDD